MSDIDWRRLRSITAREIINALSRDGFEFSNQRGSHQRYRHTDGRRVTVTFHRPGDTFPIGTLRSMIERQARWSGDDLVRLGLLRPNEIASGDPESVPRSGMLPQQ